MVGWRRHILHSIIRRVGNSPQRNLSAGVECSSGRICPAPLSGHFPFLQRALGLSSDVIPRPFYRYLQESGISSSRKLLAESDANITPVRSPLTPVLAIDSGKTESQAVVSKPSKVQAVRKDIKQDACSLCLSQELEDGRGESQQPVTQDLGAYQIPASPKKVNLVAALVRGMRVEDALLQLQVTVKRAAKTVYQVINSARANATHNHGLDPDRLLVAEAFVGKGYFKKRVSYHARGKSGIMVRPECRLTVVVREITAEEEAEIARLRVSKFLKLTKRERRLVPHQLIETTPRWSRKRTPE